MSADNNKHVQKPQYTPFISLGNVIAILTLGSGGVGVFLFLYSAMATAQANDAHTDKRLARVEHRVDSVEARLDRQYEIINEKLDRILISRNNE